MAGRYSQLVIQFFASRQTRRTVLKNGGVMGDDAEYQMEQDELERSHRESQRQARVDEDARRNRKWEQAAAAKEKESVPDKPTSS